jgi:endonuclease/exonuclease/phosphatase family metal-dependent hydrolase
MLGMELHFHPAVKVMEELYGDAILTARPSRLVKAGALPGPARWPELEPRGALWAVIEMDGVELNVINTHLGLSRPDRRAQVEELLGTRLARRSALPRSRSSCSATSTRRRAPTPIAAWRASFAMPRLSPAIVWPRATFPAYLPVLRLDHVFVSPSVEVLGAKWCAPS